MNYNWLNQIHLWLKKHKDNYLNKNQVLKLENKELCYQKPLEKDDLLLIYFLKV